MQTDNGTEFKNKLVSSYLKKQNIEQDFCQQGNKKCLGKGERFNRTLRLMISKYMTANNTTKWIDVLPKFVKNYNNSEHSVIKKKPKNVTIKDEKRIIQDAIDKTVSIIPFYQSWR